MLTALLHQRLGGTWRCRALNASGLCETWRADSSNVALFVKTTPLARADVLEAEADGLRALAASRTVRVPDVVDVGRDDSSAWLALEWLEFEAGNSGFGERFGVDLAALHLAPAPGEGRFGWHRDNWLGGTPQGTAGARRAGSSSSRSGACVRSPTVLPHSSSTRSSA